VAWQVQAQRFAFELRAQPAGTGIQCAPKVSKPPWTSANHASARNSLRQRLKAVTNCGAMASSGMLPSWEMAIMLS
jgi:hypothetical protein